MGNDSSSQANNTTCADCGKPKKDKKDGFWDDLLSITTAEYNRLNSVTDSQEKKSKNRSIPICDRLEALEHAIAYFKESKNANTETMVFKTDTFRNFFYTPKTYKYFWDIAKGNPIVLLKFFRSILIQYLRDINSNDARNDASLIFICTHIMNFIHKAADEVFKNDQYFQDQNLSFSNKFSSAQSPLDNISDDMWWDPSKNLTEEEVHRLRVLSAANQIGFIQFIVTPFDSVTKHSKSKV